MRLLVPDTLYNKSGVDALDKLSEKLNNKGYRVTPNRVCGNIEWKIEW